jgi:ribokinase
VPNETEFVTLVRRLPNGPPLLDEAALQQLQPDEMHELCRRLNVPTVIVTLGSRGCFISEPSRYIVLPAYPGIRVVDTTGAGDAFCGGFAAGFVKHDGNILEAARLGTAVAALSVTKPGAAGAMPRKPELTKFLRQRGVVSPAA